MAQYKYAQFLTQIRTLPSMGRCRRARSRSTPESIAAQFAAMKSASRKATLSRRKITISMLQVLDRLHGSSRLQPSSVELGACPDVWGQALLRGSRR